ncbi:MAG: phosphatidylglycerophosphatase A [Pirellulales bacterium]
MSGSDRATITAMESSPRNGDQRVERQPPPTDWSIWVATGLGAGWSPLAPGTVGAAVWGLPFALAVGQLAWPGRLLAIFSVCAFGIPICTRAARAMGGKKDPGSIVLDEIASMPMTFLLVPMVDPVIVLIGFVLNRLFDITKPPPARQCEQLPEGWGIMVDDWVAGIYSGGVLYALAAWQRGWFG